MKEKYENNFILIFIQIFCAASLIFLFLHKITLSTRIFKLFLQFLNYFLHKSKTKAENKKFLQNFSKNSKKQKNSSFFSINFQIIYRKNDDLHIFSSKFFQVFEKKNKKISKNGLKAAKKMIKFYFFFFRNPKFFVNFVDFVNFLDFLDLREH